MSLPSALVGLIAIPTTECAVAGVHVGIERYRHGPEGLILSVADLPGDRTSER